MVRRVDAANALREKLRALNEKYARQLPDLLHKLTLMMLQCQAEGAGEEDVVSLHRAVHTLAGSAGTFGFPLLGEVANGLETQLKGLMDADACKGEAMQRFVITLSEMLQWAKVDPTGGIADAPRFDDARHVVGAAAHEAKDEHEHAYAQRLIYVVDDDPLVGKEITAQLEYFGYEVQGIVELDRLAAAIDQRMPAAIVIDLGFPQGALAGAAEINRIFGVANRNIPTIFISLNTSFEARLAALRAGAHSYFAKPLDMNALTERLDVLTIRKEKQPYRILIVDDEAITTDYYGAILRSAGMEVKTTQDPAEILTLLGEYRPELILMDVYMPGCSGIELAKLIRQDNLYVDIPIVFLSTERNFGEQLLAIQSGGDDFLTKPISPNNLILSLSNRAERYRSLRDLIMRDSLTGLYNHSTIKENLIREFARCKRAQVPLCLAMIDMDHFKHVNDTYGHPMGDQVIRGLSRLLQQRLRRTDIIGRYGGEEFAVILPDTAIALAQEVLNELRLAFSKIRFHAAQCDFNVTLSVGLVALHDQIESNVMFAEADSALYRAKGNGRNRVELAA